MTEAKRHVNYQSPLARARGLGSVKNGTEHWWMHRLTSVALIPLVLWLGVSVLCLPDAQYESVTHWIRRPWNATYVLALIITVFMHAMLGLQVIVEDYVHTEWLKITTNVGIKLLFSFLGLAACFATLRIVFTG